MTLSDWTEQDYHKAEEFLDTLDEEPKNTAVVDCGGGLTAILPRGIPALGVGWQGALMLAPLPLLLAWPVWVLGIGLPGSTGSAARLGIVVLSLFLIAGLIRVVFILLNNRTLFPRKYFATVSASGVAMHFSRTHFPLADPRAFLAWNEVAAVSVDNIFFPPALLTFRPRVPCLHISGSNGKSLTIPFRLPGSVQQDTMQETLQWIQSRIKP